MGVATPPVAPQPPPVAPQPPPVAPQPPPAPAKSTDKKLWYALAAIGAAVVLIGGAVIVTSGDEDGTAVVASPSASPSPSLEPSPTGPSPTISPSPTAEVSTPPTGPTGPTGATLDVVLGASCFSARGGYGMSYPAGWFTPTQRAWECQLFDPQPYVVEPNTEPPIVAVSVYVEEFPFSELLPAVTDPAFYEVLSTEQGTFGDAARPGTVVETVQIDELFFPAGTRTYSVLVDMLDRTIVVTTNDLAFTDYEQNKAVVLAMAQSLSVAG